MSVSKAPAIPEIVEVVDSLARDQIEGIRNEFHEFRAEVKSESMMLRNEMNAGIARIMTRMDEEKSNTLKDMGAGKGLLITSGLAIVGLAFSFTTLVTQPLRDGETRLSMEIRNLRDGEITQARAALSEAKITGSLLTQAEANRKTIDDNMRTLQEMDRQLHSQSMSCERRGGDLTSLREIVRDIDLHGSRRWVGKPDP